MQVIADVTGRHSSTYCWEERVREEGRYFDDTLGRCREEEERHLTHSTHFGGNRSTSGISRTDKEKEEREEMRRMRTLETELFYLKQPGASLPSCRGATHEGLAHG